MVSDKKIYLIFFCLFFSFNTFGSIGRLAEGVREFLNKGAKHSDEITDQGFNEKIDTPDKVQGLVIRGAKHSNEMIDREFNRIMDEVLEITEMTREDIPEHILDNLRNVTRDPLKLIEPDSPYRVDTAMFFRPGHDEKIVHLHRAFLQKTTSREMESLTLVINSIFGPNNRQTERLALVVDRFFETLNSPVQAEFLSRKDILFHLFVHRGVTTISGSPSPEFLAWIDDIYESIYRKQLNEEAAKKAFEGGHFDGKAFFAHWENQDFRAFVIQSGFMTRERLAGNTELLLRWSEGLKGYSPNGPGRQLATLIETSFREISSAYNVEEAFRRDAFWQTVMEACNGSGDFALKVGRIIKRITPVAEDQGPPLDLGRIFD